MIPAKRRVGLSGKMIMTLGLLALAVAVGAGVYITVRAWRLLPHLRWWGAAPLVACALFLLGGPVAHLASAWVLIGTGLSLLAKTR